MYGQFLEDADAHAFPRKNVKRSNETNAPFNSVLNKFN